MWQGRKSVDISRKKQAALTSWKSSDSLLFILHKSFRLSRKQEENKKKEKKRKNKTKPTPEIFHNSNPISWSSQMADAWGWNPPIPPPLLQQQSILSTQPALPATQGNGNGGLGPLEQNVQFLYPQLL